MMKNKRIRDMLLRGVIAGLFLGILTSGCNLKSPQVVSTPTGMSPVETAPLPAPTESQAVEASPTIPPSPTTLILPTDTQTQPVSTPTPEANQTSPASTDVPVPQGSYAVILVEEGDVLNVRSNAGASNDIVATLQPQATGITLTGNQKTVDGSIWVEINRPEGGTGWVNFNFLTQQVSSSTFCNDPKVTTLLGRLNTAVTTEDGDLLSSLVSPRHGMTLHYLHSGTAPNYTSEEARWVFDSTYVTNWGTHPASGLEVKGTFREEVLPKLVEVFSSNYELKCNEMAAGGLNYEIAWPFSYRNLNFYSVYKPGSPGVDLDWRTWVVGVEYVDGVPYIFSLHQYFWEP